MPENRIHIKASYMPLRKKYASLHFLSISQSSQWKQEKGRRSAKIWLSILLFIQLLARCHNKIALAKMTACSLRNKRAKCIFWKGRLFFSLHTQQTESGSQASFSFWESDFRSPEQPIKHFRTQFSYLGMGQKLTHSSHTLLEGL